MDVTAGGGIADGEVIHLLDVDAAVDGQCAGAELVGVGQDAAGEGARLDIDELQRMVAMFAAAAQVVSGHGVVLTAPDPDALAAVAEIAVFDGDVAVGGGLAEIGARFILDKNAE